MNFEKSPLSGAIYYQNNPFRHISAEILPKNLWNLFIKIRLCT